MSWVKSVFPYYPKYTILDQIINSKEGTKKLTIFIDLRNCLQTIYLKEFILYVTNEVDKTKRLDTTIISSVLLFMESFRLYAIQRKIEIEFIFFFEMGPSYYHENVLKTYKSSRKQDTLYGLDIKTRELFSEVIQKNLLLFYDLCKLLPKVACIKLENLEADFVPYYILKSGLITSSSRIFIVLSNDKDMLQNLSLNYPIYQYLRNRNGITLLKNNEGLKYFTKKSSFIGDSYLPLVMSFTGDSGDNIPGIKGIGPVTALKIVEDLSKKIPMEKIYLDTKRNRNIFESVNVENKYTNKFTKEELSEIIKRNLKLISFELLSDSLETSLQLIKRKEIIEESINNLDERKRFQVVSKLLDKLSVFRNPETLFTIFFQYMTEEERKYANDGPSFEVY